MARETVEQRRARYEALLENPQARTMLDLIAAAEGVRHGYSTGFGNTVIESLADHPRALAEFRETSGRKNLTSAAGRYQFLQKTWDDVAKRIGATDFGAENQDLAALYLIDRRGALDAVLEGDFSTAIGKLGKEWASLPSSNYEQPKRSQEFVNNWLAERGAERTLPVGAAPAPAAGAPAGMPQPLRGALADAVQMQRSQSDEAVENDIASRVREILGRELPAPAPVVAVPDDAAPPGLAAIRDMQQSARALPVDGDNRQWEQELLAGAVDAEADVLRQNAVGSFFGDPAISRVRLPKALEDAISRALRSI